MGFEITGSKAHILRTGSLHVTTLSNTGRRKPRAIVSAFFFDLADLVRLMINFTSTSALFLSIAFTTFPMVAQADTAPEATALVQNAPANDIDAERAAAETKASVREFYTAQKALREAKTEDASAADLDIIRTAAAAGNTLAMVSLGDYLLTRDAAAAIDLYESASSAGDLQGHIRFAFANWNGTVIERNRERAVTLIKQAVNADHVTAIMVYARWLPIVDTENGVEQALSLIEDNADILDATKTAPLVAQIRLQAEQSYDKRDTVAILLNELPEGQRYNAILRTLLKDKNLYVWLMQGVLVEHGHYSGRQNGLLTSSTIRGFGLLCSQLGISSDCIRGPLNFQSAKAVANALKAAAS